MYRYSMLMLCAALVWLAMPCQAQSLDRFFQERYELLDKNALETGILIHRSPLFIWPVGKVFLLT